MATNRNIPLTASEISQLWANYMVDTMAICVLRYLLEKVEESEIKSLVEYALHLAQQHVKVDVEILQSEGHPIPIGYTDHDVNINARRLYSDGFILHYLKQMGTGGVSIYGVSLSVCARSDVREHFRQCIASSTDLLDRAIGLLLSKGLYARSPYIPAPESPEFIKKESFMAGLLGDRRPLDAVEITHLYLNVLTNALGRALLMGFAQVARDEEVVKFLMRGRDIARKHEEVFSSTLRDDVLPAPETLEALVTDSTDAPFSDKLMMFHTLQLVALGIGNYGASLGGTMRKDIAADYLRLLAEIGTYAEDGASLMIDKGWLEKVPGAVERDALIKK